MGAAGLLFLFLPTTYWLAPNRITITINLIIKGIVAELTAVLGNLVPLGRVFNLMRFFLFIIFSNFLGLFQYKNILVHLVPVGTPAVLIPVIVIIETIRNLIRPGALAVRLAANMVAGHLLLSLLGGQGAALRVSLLCGLIIGLVLLMVLECAVACIQAYVFTILSTLYLNELIRVEFNQKILSK